MSTESLYQKNYFNRLGEFTDLAPEAFEFLSNSIHLH